MGKYMELNFGITKTINSMIHLGMKKSEMIDIMKKDYLKMHSSLDGFDYRKNSFIRSVQSVTVMRQAQKKFVLWAKKNNIKKFELVTRDDLCCYLLDRSKETTSAHTVSRELHFVNKVFSQDITKKELCLPSRLQKNITRGRSGLNKIYDRPHIIDRNRDAIDIVRATGMRRSSVTRFTYESFNFSADGRPISITLPPEKGGKIRTSYVLHDLQKRIKTIIEPFKDNPEPIIKTYSKDINSHFFRHEYACNLLNQLQTEHDENLPYFGGDFFAIGRITSKERLMYPHGFKGFDLEPAALLSQSLGHNRIDILKSYIW